MQKKKYVPDKHSAHGYCVWDIRRLIREAENVSRWNPWLAHAWMNEAREQISLDKPFYQEFDSAVERINAYWENLKKYRWYDENYFWSLEGEPLEPTPLEPTYV